MKLHEDWGSTPAAIDSVLTVAAAYDVQVNSSTLILIFSFAECSMALLFSTCLSLRRSCYTATPWMNRQTWSTPWQPSPAGQSTRIIPKGRAADMPRYTIDSFDTTFLFQKNVHAMDRLIDWLISPSRKFVLAAAIRKILQNETSKPASKPIKVMSNEKWLKNQLDIFQFQQIKHSTYNWLLVLCFRRTFSV